MTDKEDVAVKLKQDESDKSWYFEINPKVKVKEIFDVELFKVGWKIDFKHNYLWP